MIGNAIPTGPWTRLTHGRAVFSRMWSLRKIPQPVCTMRIQKIILAMIPCTVAGNSRPPWWCPRYEPTRVAQTPTACSGTWKRDLSSVAARLVPSQRTHFDKPRTMPMGKRMAHTKVWIAIWRQRRPTAAYMGVHDPVDGDLGVDVHRCRVPVCEHWCQMRVEGGSPRGSSRNASVCAMVGRRVWRGRGVGSEVCASVQDVDAARARC